MNRNKRIKVKTKERPPRRKILNWTIGLFFCLLSYQAIIRFAEPRLLPVRHIKVDATCERVNLSALKHRISPHVKGFFSTNVMTLKEEILSEPFVDEVIIKRVWPDTLLVTLTELKLIASWGEAAAVSSRGEVVYTKVDPRKRLPTFMGPIDQVGKILDEYNLFLTMLHPFNLSISSISLNPRWSWQITLDNGVKLLLGRKNIAERLSSFVSIYPKIRRLHGNNIESIDLRHSNGVSVHLKDAAISA